MKRKLDFLYESKNQNRLLTEEERNFLKSQGLVLVGSSGGRNINDIDCFKYAELLISNKYGFNFKTRLQEIIVRLIEKADQSVFLDVPPDDFKDLEYLVIYYSVESHLKKLVRVTHTGVLIRLEEYYPAIISKLGNLNIFVHTIDNELIARMYSDAINENRLFLSVDRILQEA
ncbi:MAG: hypothetical protein ACMG57_04060 [Candidatus Dojkabacteria bacterium]